MMDKNKLIERLVRNFSKARINESQGVVEKDMVEFAEYLWKRCRNNKLKPNRYGEVNFTIPYGVWKKFNTYNLSCERISVSISNRTPGEWASFRPNGKTGIINISEELVFSDHNQFINAIMHELTHAINVYANSEGFPRIKDGKINRHGCAMDSIQGKIEYLFEPSEMNARLSEAYYYLGQEYDRESFNMRFAGNTNQEISYFLFEKIKEITCYYKMENLLQKVYNDMYGEKIKYSMKNGHMTDIKSVFDKEKTIVGKLKFGKNFNDDLSFRQYFKKKLDIAWFMENELEKFRKRIYKMIYKFMQEMQGE